MRIIISFLALLLAIPGPALAQLSKAEQVMLRTAEQEQERNIAFLERMVNQNSGSLNFAGVKAVAEMVRAELEPLGFKVEWVPKVETGRAGHLIATRKGNGGGKRMLLIAHLDTVFEPDSPFQHFDRQGERATGPGIGDDKGGIVVIVGALRAMQVAGTLKNADMKIVFTGDEESVGKPAAIARQELIEAGKWADVALEFENLARENGQEMGTTARRSSTNWTLRTSGRTGHSSGVFGPTLGYGAIYEMVRILDAFRRDLPEPKLTYNVSVIGGGTPAEIDADNLRVTAAGKTNIIAETAIARGDLRSVTVEQDERVRARMMEILGQSLPGTKATLEFSDGYPPMEATVGNRALLAGLNAVSRDLGMQEMPEMDPAKRGAADSSFVAPHVDTIGGLGASGGGAHAVGEWIDLQSIRQQAQRMAVFMSRLARERRPRSR